MKQNRRIKKNILLPSIVEYRNECGVCSLYYLKKNNIHSVKIVGRGHPLNSKIKYVSFIKKSIDILQTCSSFETFQKKSRKLYMSKFSIMCNDIACYYPDLL